MAVAQDGLLGRPKAEWTPSRDAYLVELFIDQQNKGRTAYNEFKNDVIRSVTRDFNKKFGMCLEENQIKNRYNVMKKDYGVVKTLLSHTGFGWDETRQMVVADDKFWDNYIAVRCEARPFRRKSFPLYKQMSIIFEGERGTGGKIAFPSGAHVETEEGNSNTETVRSSEPSNLPIQAAECTFDSDSIVRINDTQSKKRKSLIPSSSNRKKRVCDNVGETFENALYEIFSAATLKAVRRNKSNEKSMYQKCLEELQKLEELDDTEFTQAVNVLKDDKNAIAFMTIRGPRRLIWLRSLWQCVETASFKFINKCRHTVWPGLLSGANTAQLQTTGFTLNPSKTRTVTVPKSWSGRVWGRTLCSVDSSNKFSCLTGDCGSGVLQCSGSGAKPPATLAEFTLNGAGGQDFYDVSLVDGYNIPILVIPRNGTSGTCSATGCLVDLNRACPKELRITARESRVACRSACEAFGDPRFCCSEAYSTPDTCGPSAYSLFFKHACPRAYSYAYDDTTSTYTCIGADYIIMFCPPPYTSQKLLGARKEGATLPLVNKTMMHLSR